MIAKNKKGKSFGGCVRYVINEGCEVLEAEGVDAEDATTITRDFAIQRSGRPEIKQPVGHIAVSFSPEDSPRMTGDFMLKLAHEYMAEMNIRNTQYIVVRHHNTDHEHFHIVYNRIDNDLKLISVNNDYRRNVAACKKLKDRHGLTYGTGKEKVNRPKLTGADKVKYQIHDEIAANLPHSTSYTDLEKRLRQAGITIQYKYRSGAEESPENIQGISFAKGGITFKGSRIDRKFSHANVSKVLSVNLNEAWEKMKDMIMPEVEMKPHAPRYPVIYGVEITAEQDKTLNNGGHIYLKNMVPEDENGKFSAYVFYDDEKTTPITCPDNPDTMIDYNGFMIRLRDIRLIGEGFVAHADVKLQGETDIQKLFVWKDPQGNDIMYSPTDPHLPAPPMVIRGVEITAEQENTLHDGGHIFLEGMDKRDGSGKFSSHVFMDDERKQLFFSKADPDTFVKYGGYEMRLRDKRQVEKGLTTRAIIRLGDGELAGARLWKDNPDDAGYNVSWDDPRIAKEQIEQVRKEREQSAPSPELPKLQEQEKQVPDNRLRRPPAVNRTPPAVNRTPPPKRTVPPSNKQTKGPKIS